MWAPHSTWELLQLPKHEPLAVALETTEQDQVSEACNVFWKAGTACPVPAGLPQMAYNQRLRC